jgi:hypothetical protein
VELVSFVTLAILKNYKNRENRSFFSQNTTIISQPVSQNFRGTSKRQKRQKPYLQLAISFSMGLGRKPFPLCRYNTSAEQEHGISSLV